MYFHTLNTQYAYAHMYSTYKHAIRQSAHTLASAVTQPTRTPARPSTF